MRKGALRRYLIFARSRLSEGVCLRKDLIHFFANLLTARRLQVSHRTFHFGVTEPLLTGRASNFPRSDIYTLIDRVADFPEEDFWGVRGSHCNKGVSQAGIEL
jgi:hypothetical protein